ncbi:MAG: carboxypeptidase-like regulatory domain-containing protein [Planctomycetaceae bacterium]
MKRLPYVGLVTPLCLLMVADGTNAGDEVQVKAQIGGVVTGQIVFEGDPPKIEPLVEAGSTRLRDAAVCAAQDIPNETVLVHPESKGIANVFVYLPRSLVAAPEARPQDEKPLEFTIENCRFRPHASFVRTGRTVEAKSEDPIATNLRTEPRRNDRVNVIVKPKGAPGDMISMRFERPEPEPIVVASDLHPWMRSYWLVLDHPYGAITDEHGKFRIENLPAGTHKFVVWHERAGFLDREYEVTLEEGRPVELPPYNVPRARFTDRD